MTAQAQLTLVPTASEDSAKRRQIVEGAFQNQNSINKPTTWQGFWFDWVCARIHLQEATALIEGSPDTAE